MGNLYSRSVFEPLAQLLEVDQYPNALNVDNAEFKSQNRAAALLWARLCDSLAIMIIMLTMMATTTTMMRMFSITVMTMTTAMTMMVMIMTSKIKNAEKINAIWSDMV